MGKAYARPQVGDWVQPRRRGYKLACDCGLVHTMHFRIYRGRVQFQVCRNERATAAIHREARKRQ